LNGVDFKDRIERLREVVKAFRKSSKLGDALSLCRPENETSRCERLVLDVETRWNSTFGMLLSLTKFEGAIRDIGNRKDLRPLSLPVLEDSYFKDTKSLLSPLQACKEEATGILSGADFFTYSKVDVAFAHLLRYRLESDALLFGTFSDPPVIRMDLFFPEQISAARRRL
jgi:hypothetical protein